MRIALIILVVAVLLIVLIGWLLVRWRNSLRVDYTTLAQTVKDGLPKAPGIYGWKVTVFQGSYQYTKRYHKTCHHDNKTERHTHHKPAVLI